jgi:hypothetical protein
MLPREYKGKTREREIGILAKALSQMVHDSPKDVLSISNATILR